MRQARGSCGGDQRRELLTGVHGVNCPSDIEFRLWEQSPPCLWGIILIALLEVGRQHFLTGTLDCKKGRKQAELTQACIDSFLRFDCGCRVISSLKRLLLPANFLVSQSKPLPP